MCHVHKIVRGSIFGDRTRPHPTQFNPTQPDTTNSKTIGSNWSTIVTMAISCTVFELMRDIGRKTPIFRTPLYLTCTVPCNCMLCNDQKYSTFVIFDPTRPNPSKTAKSRPNPLVGPTHGQFWCAIADCQPLPLASRVNWLLQGDPLKFDGLSLAVHPISSESEIS